MKNKMECKLCKNKITDGYLSCSKGTICMKCSKDISLAEYQPVYKYNDILWILAETFFRKGNGEDVNFEEVWKENSSSRLIKPAYIIKTNKNGNYKQ